VARRARLARAAAAAVAPAAAIACTLAQPLVTSVIIGAKDVAQLDDNLAATQLELSTEELATLDQASALPPEYPGWMVAWQNREPR